MARADRVRDREMERPASDPANPASKIVVRDLLVSKKVEDEDSDGCCCSL